MSELAQAEAAENAESTENAGSAGSAGSSKNAQAAEDCESAATKQTPPPSQSTRAPNPPPHPQRVRRVGTFTMGLSLIASGGIALLCLFNPNFDIVNVLRFTPLILIFLGAEILLCNFLHRDDRLKYDFLSGLVCFLLICASVGMAILPPLFEQYGPERESLRRETNQQIEAACYQALGDDKQIQSMTSDLYLNGSVSDYREAGALSLRPTDHLQLSFTLAGDFPDETRFAEKVHAVLSRLSTLPFTPSRVHFTASGGDAERPSQYELGLDDAFELRQDVEGLARMTQNDSEWKQLEEERQSLYAELEEQRGQLAVERAQLTSQLDEERAQLISELDGERNQLADEREQLVSEINGERAQFTEEREQLVAELEAERARLNQSAP